MEIQKIIFEFKNSIEVVLVNGKSIRISGEWTTSPAFYANLSSLTNWNPPNNDIALSKSKKYDIIEKVVKFSRANGTPVYWC